MDASERPLVMVVDDDDDVRESLTMLLEDEGYAVMTATNGAVAFEKLKTAHPRAIVLDLMMPVMTGWEFRDRQLHNPALADIPVVVLTAAGEPIGDLGGARVLQKTAGMRVLLTAVERACA